MRTALVAIAVFTAGLAAAGHAQTDPRRTSGFPLDFGRPNDGLPLPDGPRGPPPQRAPYARGPSMALALIAARAAVAACRGSKIAVSIIDSAGMPKLYYVPDGTTGYNAYTGFRKAWTALTFRLPTSAKGELIGAIGVSGAEPSATDERCGVAALKKIQSRL